MSAVNELLLRPNADSSLSGWTDQAGSSTAPLYTRLTDGTTTTYLTTASLIPAFDVANGTLPGQIGGVSTYVTATGTVGYMRTAYLGGASDNLHAALVILPPGLDSRVATPHVVFLHGANGDETIHLFDGIYDPHTGPAAMVDDWLDRGWGIISLREGSEPGGNWHTDLWGNYACRVAMVEVLNAYAAIFTQSDHGMPVYGTSMGGTMAINLALQSKLTATNFSLAAVAIIDPAINLQYIYNYAASHPSVTAMTEAVTAAYSIPGGTVAGDSVWNAHVNTANNDANPPGHDGQIFTLSDLPTPTHAARLPFYVLSSPGDNTIDETVNAQPFCTRLDAAAWTFGVDVIEVEGLHRHVHYTHFIPSTQSAFFNTWLTS